MQVNRQISQSEALLIEEKYHKEIKGKLKSSIDVLLLIPNFIMPPEDKQQYLKEIILKQGNRSSEQKLNIQLEYWVKNGARPKKNPDSIEELLYCQYINIDPKESAYYVKCPGNTKVIRNAHLAKGLRQRHFFLMDEKRGRK